MLQGAGGRSRSHCISCAWKGLFTTRLPGLPDLYGTIYFGISTVSYGTVLQAI